MKNKTLGDCFYDLELLMREINAGVDIMRSQIDAQLDAVASVDPEFARILKEKREDKKQ